MIMAMKIEVQFSKDEILGLYLDHAPYGGNIIGYQAAVYRYFGKSPGELTWSEAATLAVLPNAPGMITPVKNDSNLVEKRNRLLENFKKKIIDQETYVLSCIEEIPHEITPFENPAPHVSRKLKNLYRNKKVIITTLDDKIQRKSLELTASHLGYLRQFGIRNGAVLVAETQTGKVRAYVGSQAFFDQKSLGQVDGVMAPRSSGSVLKPFLFALAIDEGIVLPQTLMKDIPTFYGAFSPSNASESYDGLVTAQDALIRSLNVPSVRLLNAYGIFAFYTFLENSGIETLFRSADDYGLPLIIGGSEVTLWDMAMLFKGLANYGTFEPLQLIEEERLKNESSAR
ncbi:MAG: penicillin-binding protein 1C, partial [Bacteroidales bacterium]|nr:penicillin-binding protein 1C [Bacteroidales bacterium]